MEQFKLCLENTGYQNDHIGPQTIQLNISLVLLCLMSYVMH